MSVIVKLTPSLEEVREADQMEAVILNPYAIKNMRDPSEAVQLMAVRQDGNLIQYIRNSSEAVRLAAVRKTPQSIEHIWDPSDAVQLAAARELWGRICLLGGAVKITLVNKEDNKPDNPKGGSFGLFI